SALCSLLSALCSLLPLFTFSSYLYIMIALMTDFGQIDAYPGIMKGVIKSIDPQADIVDLTHSIPPQDLDAARFVLWNSYKYYPKGTIFVCVIDPGVGSERDILVVQTHDYVFIVPDNGLLDYVLAELPVKLIMAVKNPRLQRSHVSHTFHGRDIFAPTAAHLSAGFLITQVGPVRSYRIPLSPFIEPLGGETQVPGKILYTDHFGNLISNLKVSELRKGYINIGDQDIPLGVSYHSVENGELVGIKGSHGLLEIAQRNGNAAHVISEKEFQLFLA
ncbi:MAG: SAM-dependent chlorinase/fluorinase, partial [Bacteroidota bacterium]